jgi:predicted RNA methylase
MKKLSILFILIIGLILASEANAQITTPIQFEEGKSEKVLTITVGASKEAKYSINVKKNQIINFLAESDIMVSKKDEFPVISLNLDNGSEDVDNWQDGEGYLSIFSGKAGKYVVTIANSDKKRARTFKLTVKVSNNKEDFMGEAIE